MLIKTSTYPFGPANKLADGDIVQRVQSNGRFIDAYKYELIEGDEYYVPTRRVQSISFSTWKRIAYLYPMNMM